MKPNQDFWWVRLCEPFTSIYSLHGKLTGSYTQCFSKQSTLYNMPYLPIHTSTFSTPNCFLSNFHTFIHQWMHQRPTCGSVSCQRTLAMQAGDWRSQTELLTFWLADDLLYLLACSHPSNLCMRAHFKYKYTVIWQKICPAYHRLRHWLRHGHGRLCRWRSDCRCSSALSTGNQRLDCCLTMEHFLYKEWGEHKKIYIYCLLWL